MTTADGALAIRDTDASIGDLCDWGCACSAVLHIDDSGATATTNFRLTSFPMLRTRWPVWNGLPMVTSDRGMVLSSGPAALT